MNRWRVEALRPGWGAFEPRHTDPDTAAADGCPASDECGWAECECAPFDTQAEAIAYADKKART